MQGMMEVVVPGVAGGTGGMVLAGSDGVPGVAVPGVPRVMGVPGRWGCRDGGAEGARAMGCR